MSLARGTKWLWSLQYPYWKANAFFYNYAKVENINLEINILNVFIDILFIYLFSNILMIF